jgi:hypothetical protein
MKNNTIKRQKTVDNLLIQKFAIKDDLSDISNLRDKESVLNITINNIHKVKKMIIFRTFTIEKKNALKNEGQTIVFFDIEINYTNLKTKKMMDFQI